jgi:hypothetical protein
MPIVVSGVSSALGLIARQELARRPVILFAHPFVAGLIGAALGGLAIRHGWTETPGICMVVPALMLVPGPHLINGVYDVLENHVQPGVCRLGLATGILIATALGVALVAISLSPATLSTSPSGPCNSSTGVVRRRGASGSVRSTTRRGASCGCRSCAAWLVMVSAICLSIT